jgi:hypothetical protein
MLLLITFLKRQQQAFARNVAIRGNHRLKQATTDEFAYGIV